MNRIRIRTAGVVLAASVLLLAACSDDDEPNATTDTSASGGDEATTAADDAGNPYGSTEATEESTETTEAAAEGVGIAAADSSLGSIVTDAEGNTLYVFSSDTQGEASTCTGGCAGAWPALTGPVTAGDGIDEALIGTVAGEGGAEQATYDGWPLYYYAQDTAPGDTNGQGVGDVWWVIGPDGALIET